MSDDICGAECVDGSECQNPAGKCPVPSHSDPDAENPHGRPRLLDDEQTRQRVLVAVGQGLKVEHQAGLAGVSPDTLRRALCCIDSPRNPVLDAEPCDFCADYAQAHANGAREVLQDCRPEFVAAASYGYVKEEKRTVDADVDHDLADGFEYIVSDGGDE